MTSVSLSTASPAVVLGSDATAARGPAERIAAIGGLAELSRRLGAPMALQLDAVSGTMFSRIVDLLGREAVRVVPIVALDGGDQSLGSGADAPFSPLAMLRALAEAGRVAEFEGERFVGVRADSEQLASAHAEAIAATLRETPGRIRIGLVRARTALTPLPRGFDCALDWLPYAPMTNTGDAHSAADYTIVATEIARRHAGISPLAPNVPFSAADAFDLPQSSARLTGVSAIKIAYAIDVARRFVHNRAGDGVPFWLLRIDSAALRETVDHVSAALADAATARYPDGMTRWAVPSARGTVRIAVVLHLYYPELWDEFAAAIDQIGEPCDVYVSCPLRACDAVTRLVRARFTDAVVAGVHNVGRDVLPFLRWLATPGIERYAYVLKLHSKKSMHIVDPHQTPVGGGEAWRRRALAGLLPDARRIDVLLKALDARQDVGIVAPTGLLYDQITWRCATGDLMATLCRRIGIDGTVSGEFPAGTMFWARLKALAPLMQLPAEALEFDREAAQTDGTLHHAYERLFSLVATACGYATVESAQLVA